MIQSQENCLFAITVKPTSDGEGGTNVNRHIITFVFILPRIFCGDFLYSKVLALENFIILFKERNKVLKCLIIP